VGYVDYLQMYALDFEEYLWARNISDDMIRHVKEYFDKKTIVPTAIHDRLMQLFREYLAIGGMPEVVQTFVDTSDYREADRVQKALLQGYRYDIAHYATAEEKVKAERCYLSLSRQLLDKENHKFQYKEVEHGGRAQKYYSSMDWLLRADLIRMSRLVTDVKYDLEDYAREDFFRAYTTDLSLLIAMRDFSLKQHIVEDTLTGTTKGGLFECAVADILIKKGLNLYFYKHDTNQKELDFLIQTNGQVIPIEVKSGNTRATSLKWLKQRNPEISTMYKLISGNTGVSDEGIITLPVYMAMFL
jgi:predicted AAA+ superfamily ATPase